MALHLDGDRLSFACSARFLARDVQLVRCVDAGAGLVCVWQPGHQPLLPPLSHSSRAGLSKVARTHVRSVRLLLYARHASKMGRCASSAPRSF